VTHYKAFTLLFLPGSLRKFLLYSRNVMTCHDICYNIACMHDDTQHASCERQWHNNILQDYNTTAQCWKAAHHPTMMLWTANGMDLMLQGSATLSYPLFALTTDSMMLFLH
jgi:hypothetical protein